MRVNKWLVPLLALTLLLGTVGVAQATGWWLVSGRQMVNLEQLTGGVDVKGWMTLEQVAVGSGMDLATLYAELGLSADIPPETALKELEGVVEGFETSVVRTVVDEALGLAPATGAEEAPQAVATPEITPVPTATPTAMPNPTATVAHQPVGDGSGTGSGDGESPPVVTSVQDIKGRHTLQEIADATGVSLTALLDALQLPPDTDPQTAVRDLIEAGRVADVDQVKAAVAELQ